MSGHNELNASEIRRDIELAAVIALKARSSILAWKHQGAVKALECLEQAKSNLAEDDLLKAYGALCIASGALLAVGTEESAMPWAFEPETPAEAPEDSFAIETER